jgi:hypothetical protein
MKQQDTTPEFAAAMAAKADRWVPACGGHEPVSVIEGRRLQYCFNPRLHRHGYWDLDMDLILIDDLAAWLPSALKP